MPNVIPDELDPRLQGAEVHLCSKNGTSLLASGESYGFTINTTLHSRFAHGIYNTLYNVTADFTAFQYTVVNTTTNVSTSFTLTLTPGQYSTTDIEAVFTAGLDSRLTFVYNSNSYLFTMAVTNAATYRFYLMSATATWAEELFHFDAATTETQISSCTSLTIATMALTENVYVSIDAFPCTAIRIAKEAYPNILARISITAAPGDKTTCDPTDPFFVEVRNPNLSSFTVSLLDDDIAHLDLNGSPWTLTLYIDFVFFQQIDRPGDVLNTAYTRDNPLAQQPLYRRSDIRKYLMGVPMDE
jgi:hypothetical protein